MTVLVVSPRRIFQLFTIDRYSEVYLGPSFVPIHTNLFDQIKARARAICITSGRMKIDALFVTHLCGMTDRQPPFSR